MLKTEIFENFLKFKENCKNIFGLINLKLNESNFSPDSTLHHKSSFQLPIFLSKDLQSIKSIALQLHINLFLSSQNSSFCCLFSSFILADHRHQSESISSTEVQKMNENEITSSTSQLSSSQTLALIYLLLFSCCRYYVYL